MFKSLLKMLGGAGLVLVGLIFFEMIFTEEGTVGSKIFIAFCGLLFVAAGVIFVKRFFEEFKNSRKSDDLAMLKRMFQPGFEENPDRTPLEKALTGFRSRYSDFFKAPHAGGDHEIQGDVTQLYHNVLEYRRMRLDRLGLSAELTAKRMVYEERDGVKEKTYSDGKYEISEVREEIAARTVYRKDGREVFTKLDRDIANYTLIHAKQIGEEEIVCPSCGVHTTRTALLNGCDYCGTRFAIEDLGTKIAEFALNTDYDIEYAKYRKIRNKLLLWIMAVTALIVIVWAGYQTIQIIPAAKESADGVIMNIAALLFAFITGGATVTAIVWFFAAMVIAPVVIAVGGYNMVSKNVLKQLKNSADRDSSMVNLVRRYDPLFSITNFYSGVQNRLASVIYAETPAQLQAFTRCDMSGLTEKYKNVAGFDVKCLTLEGYSVQKGYQFADVQAELQLTEYDSGKCKLVSETVRMKLMKSADCRTQVVCAPAVTRCHGCGAPLNLMRGRFCTHCGRELGLEKYDWVITEFQ